MPFDKTGQHTRLRTGRKADSTDICPGSDGGYSVQRNLWLGGEEMTDVVQLRLEHPRQSKRLMTETVATSLAVCLRSNLARLLGVEGRELGWTIHHTQEERVAHRDIFLFDAAAGGAGYVASVPVQLESLLHDCRKSLQCSCDSACHKCLLDFDTQRHADLLNRREALDWLDDEFMSTMNVPKEFRCFGAATRYESRSIVESVLAESRNSGLKEIRAYADGKLEA
ncbi:MAG: DUF1998 domain-containing protein, partial [Planctomycetaceae bacterium]